LQSAIKVGYAASNKLSIWSIAMKISVRGWKRDCGTTVIADHELDSIRWDSDGKVWRENPAMYHATFIRHIRGVVVAWCQKFRLVGDYRTEIEFTKSDIVRLFKAQFGDEIGEWLIDYEGFTLSPELTKRILRKLSDVKLGDLAAMGEPALRDLAAIAAAGASAEEPTEEGVQTPDADATAKAAAAKAALESEKDEDDEELKELEAKIAAKKAAKEAAYSEKNLPA
jgi:hypothetical protein